MKLPPSTSTATTKIGAPDFHDFGFCRYIAAAFGIGLAMSLALGALLLLLSQSAYADDGIAQQLDETRSGRLLLSAQDTGRYDTAPLLRTEVRMSISGMVARVHVKQQFNNPDNAWAEGIYVFPLPENAAVDHLRMRIGTRLIEGQIKERGAAKRDYEQAKQDGKRAALIEQQRPNLFTNSVANIGPHEEVDIEIEYQQILHYDQGDFRLRFPMTFTPRYIPGTPPLDASEHAGGAPQRVPDAAQITSPMHSGAPKINPVRLFIDLDAGFALQRVDSPSHPVDVALKGEGHVNVSFAAGAVAADRDFELVWTPQAGRAPQATLFTQEKDGELYHLLMVLPPLATDSALNQAREAIFIIDTSGSMAGISIEQAKNALAMALDRLRPSDRFNVIEFNSHTTVLFDDARAATAHNLDQAKAFVKQLQADGGTEMEPALRAALTTSTDPRYLRQIVFLTDGSVGNEEQLLKLIHAKLGDNRLFTVGIGSAPNAYFMKKAAEFGRGTFTYISDVNDVRARMSELFAKLESPAMTQLHIAWPDSSAEYWPNRLPDLYSGEPLVVSARTARTAGQVIVSGQRGAETWRAALPLQQARRHEGVDVLWARNKIEALMDGAAQGADAQALRQGVLDIALRHHLVSKYTSLIAVDITPARPVEDALLTQALKNNLPHGRHYEKIFGALPQTATPAQLNMLLGMALFLAAFGVLCYARTRT